MSVFSTKEEAKWKFYFPILPSSPQ